MDTLKSGGGDSAKEQEAKLKLQLSELKQNEELLKEKKVEERTKVKEKEAELKDLKK